MLEELLLQLGCRLPRRPIEFRDLDHSPAVGLSFEVAIEVAPDPRRQFARHCLRDPDLSGLRIRHLSLADVVDIERYGIPLAAFRSRVDSEPSPLADAR